MTIREFIADDAPQIVSLFKRSVLELGSVFYSKTQVEAWAARGPTVESVVARNADGLVTLVSLNQTDEVVAYAELELNGHIDQVYALPDVAGTGVVSLLYDDIEKQAHRLGIEKLFTEASEGARRFFVKKGLPKACVVISI
ncbi:MAG: GNAT family N-acetyltransferase [Litorimonas sp.]